MHIHTLGLIVSVTYEYIYMYSFIYLGAEPGGLGGVGSAPLTPIEKTMPK
jgi:hypothetical protein